MQNSNIHLPALYDNGYLPEVLPKLVRDRLCAEEIAENGADLGELNKILLKKIEEMTLHMIKMQKELDILKSQK
jgi:hypothetical protein